MENVYNVYVDKKYLKDLVDNVKNTYKTEDTLKRHIKNFLADANGYVEQNCLYYCAYYNIVEDSLSENCKYEKSEYADVLKDLEIKFIVRIFISFDLSRNSINYKTLDSATNAFYENIISVRNSFEVDVDTVIRDDFFERDKNGMLAKTSIVFV